MSKAKKHLHSTHGFRLCGSEAEVGREVTVSLMDDGTYFVQIVTNWPGAPGPAITTIGLTHQAMAMLSQGLHEGLHNMHSHPCDDA